MHSERTCYQLGMRFAEPLPRTTLQCGPNGFNGQCHQMLPGLSVYRAYNVCYFVMQVPKKEYSSRPTVQTLLECFVRINLVFFYPRIVVYNESFRMFDRPMSNIGLLPNFAHVYFRTESGMSLIISNWLSVYRNGTRIPGN